MYEGVKGGDSGITPAWIDRLLNPRPAERSRIWITGQLFCIWHCSWRSFNPDTHPLFLHL